MSAVAVVCPHCGARQPDRDPVVERGVARSREPLKVSSEEARALLEVEGALATGGVQRGPSALFVPSPGSDGVARLAEWTLALMSAPLIFLGLMALLSRWRWYSGFDALEEAGETTITLVSLVAGGLAMVCFGFGLGLSEATVFGVTGTSAGALLARWWLRRAS